MHVHDACIIVWLKYANCEYMKLYEWQNILFKHLSASGAFSLCLKYTDTQTHTYTTSCIERFSFQIKSLVLYKWTITQYKCNLKFYYSILRNVVYVYKYGKYYIISVNWEFIKLNEIWFLTVFFLFFAFIVRPFWIGKLEKNVHGTRSHQHFHNCDINYIKLNSIQKGKTLEHIYFVNFIFFLFKWIEIEYFGEMNIMWSQC